MSQGFRCVVSSEPVAIARDAALRHAPRSATAARRQLSQLQQRSDFSLELITISHRHAAPAAIDAPTDAAIRLVEDVFEIDKHF